jgi:hypothetical protein
VPILCSITHERRRQHKQRAAHTLAHPHILTGLTLTVSVNMVLQHVHGFHVRAMLCRHNLNIYCSRLRISAISASAETSSRS